MASNYLWRSDADPLVDGGSVSIRKGEWVDVGRSNRVVPYKVYLPDDVGRDQKIPVILWSHGFGGSRDGASFLSRYLASRGFALLHVTHHGTDTSLWEGEPGHPWDILRKAKISRETTLNRFKDVPFVIDRMQDLYIDFDMDKIGMSGHSFGALSTQVAAGQLFPDSEGVYQSYADKRIRGGVSYSPVPINHLGPDNAELTRGDDEIYGAIDKPILFMTGTEDSSPIGGAPYTHRFPVYQNADHEDRYMLVKKGGDHMVYNGTRGKLADNTMRERHEAMIQVVSYAFWDWLLCGNVDARDWLRDDRVQNWIGSDGALSFGGNAPILPQ